MYYTLLEAAERLNISYDTAYSLYKTGKLHTFHVNNHIFVSGDTLKALLEEQKEYAKLT